MTAKGDAIDVGGAAGGFGVYWDRPLVVPGSFSTIAPLPGLYTVGGAMAATGRALDWFRTRSSAGVDSTEAPPRGGRPRSPPGADGVALPAVPRRRALAALGSDGARRVRRA